MRKVLLTGAAGRIGSAFRQSAGDRYDLRLVDRAIAGIDERPGQEVIEANLAELETCRQVCQGIDTVLHLAGDPATTADFYESLLDNNIKALYNIFRAAKDQQCRRVIFASSIQVIEGYPLDTQAHPEMPMKPMNLYAAAKGFGELMAHYFAYAEGLSSIAVRVAVLATTRACKTRRRSTVVRSAPMAARAICAISLSRPSRHRISSLPSCRPSRTTASSGWIFRRHAGWLATGRRTIRLRC
ncbi:MAG TPA: NAD(P)-dependent oxidoreductase, partial [Caldilineaceae bacterium]|nr:NAD(P)-dependent oxidoreductase [Caldilineaceae bacterium]